MNNTLTRDVYVWQWRYRGGTEVGCGRALNAIPHLSHSACRIPPARTPAISIPELLCMSSSAVAKIDTNSGTQPAHARTAKILKLRSFDSSPIVLTSPAFSGSEPVTTNEHDNATVLRLAISEVAIIRAGAKCASVSLAAHADLSVVAGQFSFLLPFDVLGTTKPTRTHHSSIQESHPILIM